MNITYGNADTGVECIDALLRAGADRSIRDMDGKTALDAAMEAGREDCVRALKLEMNNIKVHEYEQTPHD